MKNARIAGAFERRLSDLSALTGLETRVGLVDDVDAAFAAHDLAIAVAALERAERIANLHRSSPIAAHASRALETKCPRLSPGGVNNGGRYWDRTSGHYDVNVVLYR